jgi:hypothetical protein
VIEMAEQVRSDFVQYAKEVGGSEQAMSFGDYSLGLLLNPQKAASGKSLSKTAPFLKLLIAMEPKATVGLVTIRGGIMKALDADKKLRDADRFTMANTAACSIRTMLKHLRRLSTNPDKRRQAFMKMTPKEQGVLDGLLGMIDVDPAGAPGLADGSKEVPKIDSYFKKRKISPDSEEEDACLSSFASAISGCGSQKALAKSTSSVDTALRPEQ